MARVLKDPGNHKIYLDNDMFYVQNLRIKDDFVGDSIDESPEELLKFLLDRLGIKHEDV